MSPGHIYFSLTWRCPIILFQGSVFMGFDVHYFEEISQLLVK